MRRLILVVSVASLVACGGGAAQQSGTEEAGGLDGAAAPPAGSPAPGGAVEFQGRASFDGLSFEVPARWQPKPPSSSMRQAEYVVPRAEGDEEDGECALFVFPGTGGTVEANLQRWYSQMAQPDGGSAADRAEVQRFEAGGLPVTQVAVSGTYSGGMMAEGGPKPDFRMAAGIVETASSPWFLKCTGPEATIRAAEPEIHALLTTVE